MYEEFIRNQVFLGIPFNEEMKEAENVVRASGQNYGLDVKTVEDCVGGRPIIEDIVELIEKSEFLILDLTQENANVYYELGYADGVGNEGKDILLIAKEGTTLKFDVSHRRVLFYKNLKDLQKKLEKTLPVFIKEGRQ